MWRQPARASEDPRAEQVRDDADLQPPRARLHGRRDRPTVPIEAAPSNLYL